MINWLRYEWQATALPDFSGAVAPLVIRNAEKSDAEGVAKVLQSAFAVDSGWGDVSRLITARLAAAAEKAFSGDEPACPVILHGSRVIGASLLDISPDSMNHLLSGPSILHEYRNRGLASALLAASLSHLFKTGLKSVTGLTRKNSIADRFIYPKFGGTSRVFEGDPLKLEAA